jgi:hypothetical protein
MSNLTNAFERMRGTGLIAFPETQHADSASARIGEVRQMLRQFNIYATGFVYVIGEIEQVSCDAPKRLLIYGALKQPGKDVGPQDRIEIGKTVAACLEKDGIKYDWISTQGSLISIKADQGVEGLSAAEGEGMHDRQKLTTNATLDQLPNTSKSTPKSRKSRKSKSKQKGDR